MHRRQQVGGLAVLACAFAVSALPAAAHAVLESADPAAGARVERAPPFIVLTFDEPVETSLGSLRVIDAAGRERATGPVVHPAGDRARVGVRLAPLPRGRYVVTWQVVSADSHVVGGAYAFGVGVPAGAPPPLERDPGATIVVAVVHYALLAGALLAIGLPIGAAALRTGAGAAGLAEFAAWFVVAAAAFADVAVRASINGGTLFASFATHVGRLRGVTMLVALLGILALCGTRRRWRLLAPALGLLALSLSLAGHAADGNAAALGVVADALHLIAAATWIGLLAAGAAAGGAAVAVLRRISPVATIAVATIVLTGVVQTIRNVGAWQPLRSTPYGWLIDLKIALMLGAIGIAWSARASLARGSAAIRRRLTAELTVLAAVVAATAVLVDLPLPREIPSPVPAASASIRVRDLDVSIRAAADVPHRWTLRVDAREGGRPSAALAEVDVTVSERRTHAGPLAVPMTRDPSGGYAGTVTLPFAGAWSAFVRARSGDFDENHTTLPLPGS